MYLNRFSNEYCKNLKSLPNQIFILNYSTNYNLFDTIIGYTIYNILVFINNGRLYFKFFSRNFNYFNRYVDHNFYRTIVIYCKSICPYCFINKYDVVCKFFIIYTSTYTRFSRMAHVCNDLSLNSNRYNNTSITMTTTIM